MAYPFLETSHYTRVGRREIDLVVIHTMEAPEERTTAEAVAGWLQTTEREVSAHYCIDADSIVQCVREEDVAWGAPGVNHNGLQLELAGYAAQTTVEWGDTYSLAVLERAARLTADLCARHGIPVAWRRARALREGARGITGHADVTEAFRRSDHTDPGARFPVETFLSLVRQSSTAATVGPASATQMLRLGMRGPKVSRLQRLLRARGHAGLEVDGHFGPLTENAVRAFQRKAGLESDGVAGPLTRRALLATGRGRTRAQRSTPA